MLYNKYLCFAGVHTCILFFLISILNIRLYTLFQITFRIFLIQISLLFIATILIFYGLNGIIIYYFWSIYVCSYITILLIRLPLNYKNILTIIVYILLILTIGGLVGCLLNEFVGYINYVVNTGDAPKASSNINSGSSDGGNNPQPPKDGSVVIKNPDSSDKGKGKGLPESTSTNSINSNVSYSSTDIALQTKLDKQNFLNAVKSDVDKATDLYNQKADELAKAKVELAKFKKSANVSVGFTIVEDKPF